MSVRLYAVTTEPYEAQIVQAKTRGAALYERYLAWSDAFGGSFREFLGVTTVRAVRPAPLPPRDPAMTDDMRDLARHALGLPNRNLRSYRNRYVIGAGGKDHALWRAMAALGFAEMRAGSTVPFAGADLFWLTLSGARSALDVGETLCGEDFP